MIPSDSELRILENVYQSKTTIRQRDLAKVFCLSLGMTNMILQRLAKKGLLQIQKVNNRNIKYIVSAKGIREISRKSYRYMKRTIQSVASYRRSLDGLVQQVADGGFKGVALVGRSDVDFIVEQCCTSRKLKFRRVPDDSDTAGFRVARERGYFILYSENAVHAHVRQGRCASLRSLFTSDDHHAILGT